MKRMERTLNDEFLKEIFPPGRSDAFFDALYGGAEEGAFDISLEEVGLDAVSEELIIEFILTERPGKCMACSLTYGLPEVFERHPVIGLKEIVSRIDDQLGPEWSIAEWRLGPTQPKAPKVNRIPLAIKLRKTI